MRMLCLLADPPATPLSPEATIEHYLAVMSERVNRVLDDVAREKEVHKNEVESEAAAGVDTFFPDNQYAKVGTTMFIT